MVYKIISVNIPSGAIVFNQIWQAQADTFFQYVKQMAGLYQKECIPHAVNM